MDDDVDDGAILNPRVERVTRQLDNLVIQLNVFLTSSTIKFWIENCYCNNGIVEKVGQSRFAIGSNVVNVFDKIETN